MIRKVFSFGFALLFWIVGFKFIQFFFLPLVDSYSMPDQKMGFLFGAYFVWTIAWTITCNVISYHCTLTQPHCTYYSRRKCNSLENHK